MTVSPEVVTGEIARHHIANLLYSYVDIADRKDVTAAVGLLGSARVVFPAGGYATVDRAQAFFAALWVSPLAHRHDVSNLIVTASSPHAWAASAHYTRWTFDPNPVLHTLGEYTLVVDDQDWSISELTVTRTWIRE